MAAASTPGWLLPAESVSVPSGSAARASSLPELCVGTTVALGVGHRLIGQLQAIVLRRIDLGVGPGADAFRLQSQGAGIAPWVGADAREQRADLGLGDAAVEAQGCDAMAVEALGEVAEEAVPGIGGDPVDDELTFGDAQGKRAAAGQHAPERMRQALRRRDQQRMAVGVRGLVPQREGELHQQIRQVPRERDPLAGNQVRRRL